jgi:hypothetical protein
MVVKKTWTEKEAEKMAEEIENDYKTFTKKLGKIKQSEIKFAGHNKEGERVYIIERMPGKVVIRDGMVHSIRE